MVSRAMQVKTVNARTQGEDRRQRSSGKPEWSRYRLGHLWSPTVSDARIDEDPYTTPESVIGILLTQIRVGTTEADEQSVYHPR